MASGWWDLTMSSKKTEIFVPIILGFIILVSMISLVLSGRISDMKLIGVFSGNAGGFVSLMALILQRSRKRKPYYWNAVSFLLSPFGCLILMTYSPPLAAGYFAGAGVGFCFGWAIMAMINKEATTNSGK